MAMLFLTALLHAIVILGVGFSASGHAGGNTRRSWMSCWSPTMYREARDNPHASYLAQRTQIGAGDTDAQHAAGQPRKPRRTAHRRSAGRR